MSQLNYSVFYKAKFMLSRVSEDTDLLWVLLMSIRQWLTQKWNRDGITVIDEQFPAWTRLKGGSRLFSSNGSERPVYIESAYHSPDNNSVQQYWACRISEKRAKASGYCERDWVTEIGFQQLNASQAEFYCTISYGDTPEFIGRYEEPPAPTLPGLITRLIRNKKIKCSFGVDAVVNWATELKVGEFPQFQEALLNPERTISYIYISPRIINAEAGETELLIDPKELAKVVCGNARVFYSVSTGFTDEMVYLFGKEFSCYGGSIRVYRPGMNTASPDAAFRHRILHPSFIEEVGQEEVLKIYRRALAQNVGYYERYFGIRQCLEMKRDEMRQQRLAELRARHATEMDELRDSKLDEAIEEEQKRLEAEQTVSDLQEQIEELNRQRYSFETQIDGMRASVARATALESSAAARMRISKYPQSNAEIVDYFCSVFADRIAFSDDGIKSLKSCRLTSRDLWDILFNLATVMWDLMRSNSCPDPYKEFHNRTGIEPKRGEGHETRKDANLMRQFQTIYQGRVIDIEPHITYPREAQSVHFGFDAETGRIIIGHCGAHLDIYSTRKRK